MIIPTFNEISIVTDFMANAPASNSALHIGTFGNSAPMIQIFFLLFCGSLIAAYIVLKMAKTDEAQPLSDDFDSDYSHYLQSSKKTIFGGSIHE